MCRHTGEKPMNCPHCEYACIQHASLQWHIKKHHPGMPFPYSKAVKYPKIYPPLGKVAGVHQTYPAKEQTDERYAQTYSVSHEQDPAMTTVTKTVYPVSGEQDPTMTKASRTAYPVSGEQDPAVTKATRTAYSVSGEQEPYMSTATRTAYSVSAE